MWLSQLAYETDKPATIEALRVRWQFDSIAPFVSDDGARQARGLIAQRRDAVFVGFAGTDPAIWKDLVSAANVKTSPSDTHEGFQAVFDLASRRLLPSLRAIDLDGRPLFFAGHSLGAAVATLAAERCHVQGIAAAAVYGFGMPRVGGERFRERYDGPLGSSTYRFVHGQDVIPHAPPAAFGYCHIGRAVTCASGDTFGATCPVGAVGSDEGDPLPTVADVLAAQAPMALRRLLDQLPAPLAAVYGAAPRSLRDHFPLSCCAAFE